MNKRTPSLRGEVLEADTTGPAVERIGTGISMFVPVDSRESSWSARSRLPRSVSLSRNRTERMVQQWHPLKELLRKEYLEAQEREHLLYKLAHICTTMIRDNRRVVRGVARALEGSLVAAPTDPTHIQRYFGDLKGCRAVDELVSIVTGGVSVNAVTAGADLERASQYGNHRNVSEHLPAVWKKTGEDVRRQKWEDVRRQKRLVILKSAAYVIPNLRVSQLVAVVTHKVRIINDLSFDEESRDKKGGWNRHTDPDTVPQCLCALRCPSFSPNS